MILNVKNKISNNEKSEFLFDKNGIAGIVFYGFILLVAAKFLIDGKLIFSLSTVIIVLLLPILLIMLKIIYLYVYLHSHSQIHPI